jgi:thiosulfate reductase cytochrome b subunit
MIRRYTLFQKLWYLLTALAVLGLALTGFEIHDAYWLVGYRVATISHDLLFSFLLFLGVLYVFWLLVTDPEARRGLKDMAPGQRGVDLGLIVLLWLVMAGSGLLYIGFVIFHDAFAANVNRAAVAYVHTAGAFLVLALIVWHLYFHLQARK